MFLAKGSATGRQIDLPHCPEKFRGMAVPWPNPQLEKRARFGFAHGCCQHLRTLFQWNTSCERGERGRRS